VRRHWRARQRDMSIPEGGRGDTGRGLRDATKAKRRAEACFEAIQLRAWLLHRKKTRPSEETAVYLYLYPYLYLSYYYYLPPRHQMCSLAKFKHTRHQTPHACMPFCRGQPACGVSRYTAHAQTHDKNNTTNDQTTTQRTTPLT